MGVGVCVSVFLFTGVCVWFVCGCGWVGICGDMGVRETDRQRETGQQIKTEAREKMTG